MCKSENEVSGMEAVFFGSLQLYIFFNNAHIRGRCLFVKAEMYIQVCGRKIEDIAKPQVSCFKNSTGRWSELVGIVYRYVYNVFFLTESL